jgi:hypothetical protein
LYKTLKTNNLLLDLRSRNLDSLNSGGFFEIAGNFSHPQRASEPIFSTR